MATYSDNFNRSDEGIEDSANWAEHETGENINVVSNQLEYDLPSTNYLDGWAVYQSACDSDDLYVQIKFVDWSDNPTGFSTYSNVGILARSPGTSTKTWYTCVVKLQNTNLLKLQTAKFVASSYTAIDTSASTGAVSTGDTIKIECDGTSIEGLINDTNELGPTTDSSISGQNYGGVAFDHGEDNDVTATFDDWAMGDLGILILMDAA